MDTSCLLVLTTCPDAAVAERLGEALVGERLAACVNSFGPVQSLFRWQGGIDREQEWLLLAKTTTAAYPRLEQRLRELHPYELPEVIAVSLAAGSAAYLDWLGGSVAGRSPG